MGPIWGRQDPGGSHVGPMNFAIWDFLWVRREKPYDVMTGVVHLILPVHSLHSDINSLKPSDAYMRLWTNHHWFRKWLVAWSAPNYCLSQCWNIVNLTHRNKLQWNINRNSYIFIQENALENIICEISVTIFAYYLHTLFFQGNKQQLIEMDVQPLLYYPITCVVRHVCRVLQI